MEIYTYCIMSSHVHLIMRAKEGNPSTVLKEFKTYTSKQLQSTIAENQQESRREVPACRQTGLLWMMRKAGRKNSNVKNSQFWQKNNKPIELWSAKVIDQKVDYIHLPSRQTGMNPVVSGFVLEPEYWKYSSAIDYSGGKGLLEIDCV